MRILAPKVLLYTEMHTIGAISNNPQRTLAYSPCEHPLALQLGGAEKEALVYCAQLAEEQGFDEINLNLGCPSDRVQAGRFGACLMNEPELVAECISAMKKRVSIPVTVKTRIGIDHQDSYDYFAKFSHTMVNAGSDKLIVHARKAWLKGLSPKQNRTIPSLHYDFAYRIKEELPHIPVIINGNIETLPEINQHLQSVDGVMLGRLVCNNPFAIAAIHHHFYPTTPMPSRYEVIQNYQAYLLKEQQKGVPLSVLLKPLFNLAHGLAGAKYWKEQLLLFQQQKCLNYWDAALSFLAETEGVIEDNSV